MVNIIKFFVLLIFIFAQTNGARILAYFPSPSISHQVVFRPITQELVRRGHEVTVITTDPAFPKNETPSNLTEIDTHDISYELWKKVILLNQGKKDNDLTLTLLMVKTFSEIFDAQMQLPEVRHIMNKDRKYFDLLLLEGCNRLALAIGHKFNAPIISLSSYGALSYQYRDMGAPTHPILYPTPDRSRLYNLTVIEKGISIIWEILNPFILYKLEEIDAPVLKKHFGNDVPTIGALRKSVKMLILNEHPIWTGNRPVPPNVIYMGGIHVSPIKQVPKNLQEYLDTSTNGVIYISFGTNVLPSILPPEKIRIITNVLSQLPYNVLWKWDKDILPGQSENIKISKWFPQADLLRHPNIKLFITQGGLQSTDEAINAGVPLIGIPMFADQFYNTEKYVHHKIGLQLNIESINEDKLKQAIITVIEDESYKKNIAVLRELVRQYPIDPLNHTMWWIEHIIRYGGDHLVSPAMGLSLMEYYEVKLVFMVLSIIFVILLVAIYTLKLLIGVLYKMCNNKKEKKHKIN